MIFRMANIFYRLLIETPINRDLRVALREFERKMGIPEEQKKLVHEYQQFLKERK